MAMAQGHQDLVVNAKGKSIVRRWAVCSKHSLRSSFYEGPSDRGGVVMWAFRCSWDGHIFYVEPDRDAPKNQAEIEAWTQRQLQKRLEKLNERGMQ